MGIVSGQFKMETINTITIFLTFSLYLYTCKQFSLFCFHVFIICQDQSAPPAPEVQEEPQVTNPVSKDPRYMKYFKLVQVVGTCICSSVFSFDFKH